MLHKESIVKLKPYGRHILITHLLLLILASAFSQTKINVVTKEVNKTIINSAKSITIDAEKADIIINESKNENFNIKIKFISKHNDLEVAKEQLDFLNYVIKEGKKEIFLHNYILISSNSSLKARIKTMYILEIPKNCNVKIKNTMGEIKISDITGTFDVDLKYGKLYMENSYGKLIATIHVGDLYINDGDLNASINTNHTSCNIINSKGNYDLKTNLGSLNFELNKGVSELMLNSNGTVINLNNKHCLELNLDIISDLGSIYISDCAILTHKNIIVDTRKSKSHKKVFKYQNDNVKSGVKIVNKYNDIYIN